LPQVDVPFDRLQDPEAIANWPQTLSRDGARTPMPWSSDAPNFGFTTGHAWLPAGPDHASLTVDRQEADRRSMLQFTRACLAFRSHSLALRTGGIDIVTAGEALLVFDRRDGGEHLRCTFNLGDDALSFKASGRSLISTGEIDDETIGPYAAVIEELA
jgi:alpha-glucosidase